MKMNVVVLGTLISEKNSDLFLKKGARYEPGDLVQKYILKALGKYCGASLWMISSPRIESFPKCKLLRIKKEKFIYQTANCVSSSFLNIPFISFISRKTNFVTECRRWAKEHMKEDILILVYSLNSTFLKGAIAINEIVSKSKICVIVPDLPIYMSNYRWPISFFKKRDIKIISNLQKRISKYVLYSHQMADYLQLPENNYIVVEGFIDDEKINLKPKRICHHKKICVYAGNLEPKYGIKDLINAFEDINVNAELHIYGNDRAIQQYSLNKNTRYMGSLSPKDIFEVMKDCDLLINPRPSNLELTMYSFPSKTFEYMASGTPCVMCRLPGIPSEYYDYMYFFDEETPLGYKKTIERILSLSDEELCLMGHKAALFLANNKASEKQIKRIIDFTTK